jgi:hypothetical protein
VSTKQTINNGKGIEVEECLNEKANLGRRHEVPARDLGTSEVVYTPVHCNTMYDYGLIVSRTKSWVSVSHGLITMIANRRK